MNEKFNARRILHLPDSNEASEKELSSEGKEPNQEPKLKSKAVEEIEDYKTVFAFDIKQKHPRSKDFYNEREKMLAGEGSLENWDNISKAIKESENPFAELNGQEITHDGHNVGKILVTEGASPQCTYSQDGKPDCGVFYQITADISGKNLDLETAKELILKIVGKDKPVDYLEVTEMVPIQATENTRFRAYLTKQPEGGKESVKYGVKNKKRII